jgi:hypothetical protein
MFQELGALDKKKNLRAYVTITWQEDSWMQMGLHSEAKPEREGRVVQGTIGGQRVQPNIWYRI